MPHCVNCSAHTSNPLFKTYPHSHSSSPSTIILTKCAYCNIPLDPLLEQDALLTSLDYILHRHPAHRHIILNTEFSTNTSINPRQFVVLAIIPYVFLSEPTSNSILQTTILAFLSHFFFTVAIAMASNSLAVYRKILFALSLPWAINLLSIFISLWERSNVITLVSNAFIISEMITGLYVVLQSKNCSTSTNNRGGGLDGATMIKAIAVVAFGIEIALNIKKAPPGVGFGMVVVEDSKKGDIVVKDVLEGCAIVGEPNGETVLKKMRQVRMRNEDLEVELPKSRARMC
ncbi:hypothetical protein ScalyP_jg5064 [Parmales sp. scaly parma]|nr:hypothetical protein ScalyP_jg5064 [Parmales sp. scaly parma]